MYTSTITGGEKMTLERAGEVIYDYIKVVPKAEDWDAQRAARLFGVRPQQLVQVIAGVEKRAVLKILWESWIKSRLPIWIEPSRNGYYGG